MALYTFHSSFKTLRELIAVSSTALAMKNFDNQYLRMVRTKVLLHESVGQQSGST